MSFLVANFDKMYFPLTTATEKNIKCKMSVREVLSERMIIEDTRSHGRLELHLFEKVWPRIDSVFLSDCYRISEIRFRVAFVRIKFSCLSLKKVNILNACGDSMSTTK